MKIIGIVGGIASGKSLVANQLGQRGAVVLDADQMGHEVLCETEVKRLVMETFGETVFDSRGEINRAALAKIVFAKSPEGSASLQRLEQITHPRIDQRIRDRIQQLARQQDVPAVVLDAPVMFKAGWDRHCDQIIFVHATRRQRVQRAGQRGWSEAEYQSRELAQLPLEQKRARADIVIDNSGARDRTLQQVSEFWETMIG